MAASCNIGTLRRLCSMILDFENFNRIKLSQNQIQWWVFVLTVI
jgi:hypothetical protein